jgi:hypothetical protein
MIRSFSAILMTCVLLSFNGCHEPGQAEFNQEQASALGQFKPVTYRRSGGVAGLEDKISISSDGKLQSEGRLFGAMTAQVSEFQLMQLARQFEGWEKLQANYPAPPNVTDAFTTEIQYAGKLVTASDAAKDLPEQFRRVRERLETLTRDLRSRH